MSKQSKETIAVRVGAKLMAKIAKHQERNSMSQSDAVRDLIKEGLEDNELQRQIDQLEHRIEQLE